MADVEARGRSGAGQGTSMACKSLLLAAVAVTVVYCVEAFVLCLVPPWDEGWGSDRWLGVSGLRNVDLLRRMLAGMYSTYKVAGDDSIHRFPLVDYDLRMFAEHHLAFYLHVFFGPIAMLLGLLQLWPALRRQKPRLHRWLGRAYLLCQAISLPAGMYLSRFEYAGLEAFYGFLGMGGTTLVCSLMAYLAIVRGNVSEHREWMIRSYSVMWSSVVVFRLAILFWIPYEVRRMGGDLPADFRAPYVVCIFLSWSLALLAADIYLSYSKQLAKPKRS